jgi:hypothetical protein
VTTIRWVVACLSLLVTGSLEAAGPKASISGTLETKGCRALREVRLCFNPNSEDTVSLSVAGRRTRLLLLGWDKFLPYEMAHQNGVYRIKIGTPSRSDVDFFAYDEVVLTKVGSSFRVDRYTIATDSKCEGSPDIRMIYEFDLGRRTLTAILAPPWSSDNKVHRFARTVKVKGGDPFRLSEWDFINFLGASPGGAAIQRLCSA